MDLVIDQVTHRYEGVEALSGVSLNLREGEILCVVGPSGCGKSTLLRIAGGLERPSQGQVTLQGAPPEGCLNPLTFVFQDFALLPWRSVRGNVSLALEDRGLPPGRAEELIADALARTRLTEFAEAWPRQLSGGMKQRVAIARALAVSPAVWLMDEPLSALDAQTRELLLEDLIGLWTRERFSALYVTHNLAEAVRIGHRVALLSRRPGRLREIVEIEAPLSDRRAGDPALEAVQSRLWTLLRDEAEAADKELARA